MNNKIFLGVLILLHAKFELKLRY